MEPEINNSVYITHPHTNTQAQTHIALRSEKQAGRKAVWRQEENEERGEDATKWLFGLIYNEHKAFLLGKEWRLINVYKVYTRIHTARTSAADVFLG